MSVYLYRPPTYKMHQQMQGALRYYIDTSTTVYRVGGVWHNIANPGESAPDVSLCDVDAASGMRLYWNKPMVVPGSLHDELAALTPADPSWSVGTLTLL